ncbi:unnamed protein product [marine sediment metagenome]|uniref:Diphthamide synthase domain-containing protein n=1 Tax=marine sediment metagenome TaxID=412755 RepID=X0Z7X6_9ZZZZ
MKRKTLMSWSSGKDSAWALYKLQQDPQIEIDGLFCTVNSEFNRVAMHAIRVELLQQQASCIGLPVDIIEIPYPCSNEEYEEIMSQFVESAKAVNIEYFAFGDLFLEDVRSYREENLTGIGISPLFPIWGIPTDKLSRDMMRSELKAVITCIDPKKLPQKFIGREYNEAFLEDLPEGVDPCGEYGEFHSFVFDAPNFARPIEISLGEVVKRVGFIFVDVVERAAEQA